MKISVFNTLYYPNRQGGAEISVQKTCEEMVRLGHEVNVVSLWDGKSPKDVTHHDVKSVKWKKANLYSVFDYAQIVPSKLMKLVWQLGDLFNFVMLVRAIKYFRAQKPDVVWTNNLSGFSVAIWAAAKWLKIPVVHTARDYYLLSNNVQLFREPAGIIKVGGVSGLVKLLIFKLNAPAIKQFIGISNYILNKHVQVVKKLADSSAVIFNSVDIENENLTNNKSVHTSQRVFGFIGQTNKAKGLNLLLEAFKNIDDGPKLIVAGRVDKAVVDRYQSDSITFIGYSTLDKFFTEVDCLLVPSQWEEPFGRVVIEAIAYKTPVIASDIGGISEIANYLQSVTLVQKNAFELLDYKTVKFSYQNIDQSQIVKYFSDAKLGEDYLLSFKNALKSSNP